MATATVVKGLEGVVAANSGICWIDGYAGVLAYRGIDIHELADHSTFEETTYLLWHGKLPNRAQLDEFSRKLAEARRIPKEIYEFWDRQLRERGYHIKYEIIGRAGGLRGDVGVFLSW